MKNEYAFPSSYLDSNLTKGMTLRDYFAAKAMHAIRIEEGATADYEFVAQRAYGIADAMLKEREKEPQ